MSSAAVVIGFLRVNIKLKGFKYFTALCNIYWINLTSAQESTKLRHLGLSKITSSGLPLIHFKIPDFSLTFNSFPYPLTDQKTHFYSLL